MYVNVVNVEPVLLLRVLIKELITFYIKQEMLSNFFKIPKVNTVVVLRQANTCKMM